MPFGTDPFDVRRVDNRSWSTINDLRYSGATQNFMVPRGFVTDFASVPQALMWLVPSTGAWTLAAVLHDWFCRVAVPAGYVSSRDADGIFRRVLRELGVPWVQRWLMWTGVRWGAVASRTRRAGVTADLLPMLGWTLVAVPIVVPALVGIGLGYLVYALVRFVAGLA